jgi:carbon storage regulator
MDIVMLPFEKPLNIEVNGELVSVVVFKTPEPGNVKFGINAPRSVNVHREEIYLAIKQKQQNELEEETEKE